MVLDGIASRVNAVFVHDSAADFERRRHVRHTTSDLRTVSRISHANVCCEVPTSKSWLCHMWISPKIFSLILLLVVCHGALKAEAQTSAEDKSLGDVARESRTKTQATAHSEAVASALQNPAQQTTAAVVTNSPEVDRFIDQAKALLMREDFAELDKMADAVRSSKARVPGGGWKLSRFYEAVNNTTGGGYETDADWQNHLALLQRWTAARPQSITARVALAEAYLSYAWVARGGGYANTVTDQGWQLFQDRTKQAAKVLADATALPSKCPHWYELMQEIALAAGADKSQHRAIFEKAIEFEPLFFAYYQRYAIALLPQWGGEPGDMEAFAEESYRRVGGKEGAHIYFEIASNLCGRCGEFSADGFSWQKLQEGFAALEELYGLTPLKLNRFAFLAATYGDKAVAAKAFLRIGPNWDSTIWGSRAQFESQRSWAGLPASPPATEPTASQPALAPPASARVEQMLELADKGRNEGRWSESTQMAKQAIKTAESLPGTGLQLGRAYLIIANNEYYQGHIPEAQAMLDRAVSAVSQRAGPDSIELASTLAQAAMYAQVMNDYPQAEADLRRAIEIREKTNGPSDRELSNDLTILGNVCRVRGRNKEAMELYQRAISTSEAVQHDSLVLVSPLEQLGMMYQNMGRNEEAESTFLRLLQLMEGHLGLNSPALTDPLSKLVSLYHVMGKTASEERTQARLQAIQTKTAK